MKRIILLLAILVGVTNVKAQDYDLKELGESLNRIMANCDSCEFFSFHQGLAKVMIINDNEEHYGLIDKYGKIVVPFIYDEVADFCEGLARIKRNDKYGYVDKNGKIVIPLIYGDCTISGEVWPCYDCGYNRTHDRFRDGLAVVGIYKYEEKLPVSYFGVIDKSGKLIIPFEWTNLEYIGEGLFYAIKEEKNAGCIINKYGDIVVPFGRYKYVSEFSDGVALATTHKGRYQDWKSQEWVLIDKTGKIILNSHLNSFNLPTYHDAEIDGTNHFKEGLCGWHEKGKAYGYIDKLGKFVIAPKYREVNRFHEGLAVVREDSNEWEEDYIVIDKSGKVVIPYNENFIIKSDCSEGLFIVIKKGPVGLVVPRPPEEYYDYNEYGYVDKSGNIVIPIKYNCASNFSDGLACVRLHGKWGYIDKQGNSTFTSSY